MVMSYYSELGNRKKNVTMPVHAKGIWHGKEVTFSREFRGHLFTEQEVMALLNGETIEVHNLKSRDDALYGVQGCLVEQSMGDYQYVRFKSQMVIPNRPDYYYGMELYHPIQPPVMERVKERVSDKSLLQEQLDVPSNVQQEENSSEITNVDSDETDVSNADEENFSEYEEDEDEEDASEREEDEAILSEDVSEYMVNENEETDESSDSDTDSNIPPEESLPF